MRIIAWIHIFFTNAEDARIVSVALTCAIKTITFLMNLIPKKSTRKKFENLKASSVHRHANIVNSQNVSGDNITNASNCKNCFDTSKDIRDSAYVQNAIGPMKDSYDGYGVGDSSEFLYEVFDSGVQGSRLCFGAVNYGGYNVYYSYICHGSNNLFACIGLRNKSYCILNKQYTKEEYEALLPRIIKHMNDMPYIDKKGRVYRYGEFFPP